ncbi:MAG: hypothetical protein ACKORG_09420 [Actinomycetota bacterium]
MTSGTTLYAQWRATEQAPAPAPAASRPTDPGPAPIALLRSGWALRSGIGTTTGTVPAGVTRIVQTARTGGSAATQGFLEMAKSKTAKGKCAITVVRNKKTKKVTKRTYRCTIRLSKGTWTVTTTARGTAGALAEGTRRVVVR